MKEKIEVPELGPIALVRYGWRQLTSMRTALILLMLLGIAAIPGSLIPQRITNPIAVRDMYATDPNMARWYDRFYLFDVYGSPWFSAIYILLFISLAGCVLPRSLEHYKAMRAAPPATPRNLSRMEFHQEVAGNLQALEIASEWFKKNRFRVKREENSLSAEKGYFRETGNLLFHLSLILILVGVSFGALFGMRGEAIINVGERFINVPTTYDSLSLGRLSNEKSLASFEIKLDRFAAQYDPRTNQPRDYSAWVTVTENGKSSKKLLKVNKPLTFGNTRVYLQANGYSPVVTVRDSQGNVALQGPVPFLPQDGNLRSIGAIKVPDAIPQVGFVGNFLPTNQRTETQGSISIFPELLDPKLLFSIWKGDLGLDSGIPQSVYRLDTSNLQRIALGSVKPGETYTYAEGSITLETVVPWVNLQVVKDPGKNYALLGGIVAVLGLLSSLYGRRRRIWIRQTSTGVEVAGLAKNGVPGLEAEIADLIEAVKRGREK
jgi:cytochrome c biogenesis protein